MCWATSPAENVDAVAASMSVPVAFRPVIVESYADKCPSPLPDWVAKAATDRAAPVLLRITAQAFQLYRQPDRMKYVHLTDGGVADNFGLSSLITIRRAAGTPYGPFSARDAVKVKRLTFFVVNAEASASGRAAHAFGGAGPRRDAGGGHRGRSEHAAAQRTAAPGEDLRGGAGARSGFE